MNRSLLFLLLLLFIAPARAQEVPFDSLLTLRMKFLESSIQKDSKAGNIWWTGWLAAYSAATAIQTGIAIPAETKALRQDMYLGAATTLLGAAGQLLTPMVKVDKKMFPACEGGSRGERLDYLRSSEELLQQMAAREQLGRSWKTHAAAGVVNLGSGLITWFGFKRDLRAGLANFAVNTLITEAQIWTQPMFARRDWKRYQEQFAGSGVIAPVRGNRLSLSLLGGPGTVCLRLSF